MCGTIGLRVNRWIAGFILVLPLLVPGFHHLLRTRIEDRLQLQHVVDGASAAKPLATIVDPPPGFTP